MSLQGCLLCVVCVNFVCVIDCVAFCDFDYFNLYV